MTKRKTSTESRTSVRKMLDEIDRYLAQGGDKGRALWDVLTALRGADDDRSSKGRTTIHVRQRAFPRTAKSQRYTFASFFTLQPFLLEQRVGHFQGHIRKAAKVLHLNDGDMPRNGV